MPLPPLGEGGLNQAVYFGFEIMNRWNSNRSAGRIENLSMCDIAEIDLSKFNINLKSWDYLYERGKLSGLKGDSYKGKRVAYNHFIKYQKHQFLPFSSGDSSACLRLFDQWMERKKRGIDLEEGSYPIYLMEDSRKAHQRMMEDSENLGLIGRVVKINSEIKGYIMSAELNESTLVVAAEVTDLSIKGLAQYIFRELCQEMKKSHWINVMDDSGLESLRKVKESYHPDLLVPSYILNYR
jgi:hypothetical protein